MIKRLSTVAIGVLIVMHANPSVARPYFGFDGQHYGELAHSSNGPSLSQGHQSARQEDGEGPHSQGARAAERAAGSSRATESLTCLTAPARALLDRIEANFGAVEIVSTCRPGARIAGSGRISRHASGNAIDFEAGSRKGKIVQWLVANHHTGGTMTYSDMSHIHVDIGPHFVALGANSHTGSRTARANSGRGNARYASRAYGERSYSRYAASYDGGGSQYASGYATIYR